MLIRYLPSEPLLVGRYVNPSGHTHIGALESTEQILERELINILCSPFDANVLLFSLTFTVLLDTYTHPLQIFVIIEIIIFAIVSNCILR